MSDLTEMQATPIIVDVRGRKFTLTRLTIKDWSELDAWSEERWFEQMKARIAKFADMPDVAKRLQDRIATIKSYELRVEAASMLDTAEGMSVMLHKRLIKHYGDEFKDVQDVAAKFTELDYKSILRQIDEAVEREEGGNEGKKDRKADD